MINVLFWTWCLPQTLLGFILKLILKGKKTNAHGKEVYVYNFKSGSASLGKYILLCPQHAADEKVIKHECGHQKQSLILGWLFLLVIGLPSFLWAWFGQNLVSKIKKKPVSYYSFYTEKWADKLGGVTRGDDNG